MCLNFRIQEEDQIWFDDDIFVGELPDCNTSEMIEALDGKYMFCTFVKLRANRQKTKDKLGPEIGSVMAWPTTTTTTHHHHPPHNFF